MTIKGPIERHEWTQICVSQFTFNIVIKRGWKACMTPFLSLPPASSALTNNFSPPPPPPFRACHAGYFDHATRSHHGNQGPSYAPSWLALMHRK